MGGPESVARQAHNDKCNSLSQIYPRQQPPRMPPRSESTLSFRTGLCTVWPAWLATSLAYIPNLDAWPSQLQPAMPHDGEFHSQNLVTLASVTSSLENIAYGGALTSPRQPVPEPPQQVMGVFSFSFTCITCDAFYRIVPTYIHTVARQVET